MAEPGFCNGLITAEGTGSALVSEEKLGHDRPNYAAS